jgi:hypothetical protein
MLGLLALILLPTAVVVGFLLHLENKELFSKEDWDGEDEL